MKKKKIEKSEMRKFKDEMYKSYLFNMALYGIEPKSKKEYEKEVTSFDLPKTQKHE